MVTGLQAGCGKKGLRRCLIMNHLLQLDETIFSCPVCDCENFRNVFKPDVYKCAKCGTHFRNPRPREAEIIKCYDRGETFHKWQAQLKIRSLLWKKRMDLIGKYKREGALLDVGTGDGFFVQYAKERFAVDATEISRVGVAYAESRGHSVHHGTILDRKYDESSYDVITMWHVLEHLSWPGIALKRARTLLKDDGVLFIAVPNEFLKLISPLSICGISPVFSQHSCGEEIHLTHFTPASLRRTLSDIFGFEVVSLLADDVHVYYRQIYLPIFYINSIMAKLFRFHLDRAMVAVCKKQV